MPFQLLKAIRLVAFVIRRKNNKPAPLASTNAGKLWAVGNSSAVLPDEKCPKRF